LTSSTEGDWQKQDCKEGFTEKQAEKESSPCI